MEKAIKAVLASRGVEFPFTHDLKILLNLLAKRGIGLPGREAGILALLPYGAVLRYDELPPETWEEELEHAQVEEVVGGVLRWAGSVVEGG